MPSCLVWLKKDLRVHDRGPLAFAAYPQPIVEERSAIANAKQRMYALRGTARALDQAQAVQDKHGSRKRGLPPTKHVRAKPAHTAQRSLFE